MRRAVFLDRDGTLVEEKHYLAEAGALALYPWTLDALRTLGETGLALVVLSNQSGVARGLFDEGAVAAVNARLASLLAAGGVRLDGVYYCPHLAEGSVPDYAIDCDCRKPRPGMLDRAARELDLELPGSWVVGDKPDDLGLAATRGLRALLVRSGHGAETEAAGAAAGAEQVLDTLLEAARVIRDAEVRA